MIRRWSDLRTSWVIGWPDPMAPFRAHATPASTSLGRLAPGDHPGAEPEGTSARIWTTSAGARTHRRWRGPLGRLRTGRRRRANGGEEPSHQRRFRMASPPGALGCNPGRYHDDRSTKRRHLTTGNCRTTAAPWEALTGRNVRKSFRLAIPGGAAGDLPASQALIATHLAGSVLPEFRPRPFLDLRTPSCVAALRPSSQRGWAPPLRASWR